MCKTLAIVKYRYCSRAIKIICIFSVNRTMFWHTEYVNIQTIEGLFCFKDMMDIRKQRRPLIVSSGGSHLCMQSAGDGAIRPGL